MARRRTQLCLDEHRRIPVNRRNYGGCRLSTLPQPTIAWQSPDDPRKPLVVLLHGRGSRETDIIALANHLPAGPAYAAVRAPLAEGPGFAWFANRGIGRPISASLTETMAWFTDWLDGVAPAGRPVILVGFSGGAAFAGGLVLSDPDRFAGAAILYGTLPFDAGVPTTPGRLHGIPMFVAHGDADSVIPAELLKSTWSYLTEESGAQTTAIRSAGGHSIGQDDATALAHWITDLQGP
ncbi:serine esterase [Pseudarthrobacter sp. MDT3-28]|uniref:alpha/beta hydrolase n=1 Tax=Pseudarthrobacter raffinosi TaxID=2953651 RepID=UPI00208E36BA|nr:serine esterase [Pseudarthrobacter sp. MDT3-28]MCO4239385.1 serine esterase [Pseudarthrobacter sp. MDT3-28]